MVKRKIWQFTDPCWGLAFAHIIPYDSPDTPDWHIVHEYFGDVYFWMQFAWKAGWFEDEKSAYAAARNYSGNPQILTDLCPFTHGSWIQGFMCPSTPRLNILHGQRHEPLVIGVYWDFFNPIPPPGLHWYLP
jgi:hypothetical protein